MNQKLKTARLSIISNSTLITLKMVVGIFSGSVSIISEAIHSLMDLIAAVIAYYSVRISDMPPDREHPYGHGKYENISAVIEAVLIFVAAFWIIFEAVKKIAGSAEVEMLGLGIGVMVISGIVNAWVSRKLYRAARKHDSIALEADALHLKADVYTSLGVAAGLALIWISDFHVLDPIIAIAVAIFILKEAYMLIRRAYSPLLDVSFDDNEIEQIKKIIHGHNLQYHNLRTRKAGSKKFADFHLEFIQNPSVAEANEVCDKIKMELQERFTNIDVTIHMDTTRDI